MSSISGSGQRQVFTSTGQTITANSLTTIAHGLGKVPVDMKAYFQCVNAAGGYAVGDLIEAEDYFYDRPVTTDYGATISADATNLYLAVADGNFIVRKSGPAGAQFGVTSPDFVFILKAFG